MLYRVPMFEAGVLTGWETVNGTPISFVGFDGVEFFTHESLKDPTQWTVSEKSTGFSIAHGITQCVAIEAAKAYLSKFSLDEVNHGIEVATKMIEENPLRVANPTGVS